MAKQIIWSIIAQADRKKILKYWQIRNRSTTYSIKLDHQFRDALNFIKEHPQIGKPTDDLIARIKVVRDYLLIYETTEDAIILLTIWDSRQDPEKLERIII